MTQTNYIIIHKVIAILCLLLSLVISPPALNNTIVLTAEDWQPYVNQSAEHHGFACRIISKAFEKVGISVKYHFTKWARALDMAKKGTVDGSFLWYKTPERESFFYYSEKPILTLSVVFFHRKSMSFDWETLEDTQGLIIGAAIGSHISDEFDRYEKEGLINVQRINSHTTLFKMLKMGRIDLQPHEFIVGYNQLVNDLPAEYAKEIINHPKPLTERSSYLILTKKNPKNKKIIKLFDKGFSALVSSGEYDTFLDDVISRKPTTP